MPNLLLHVWSKPSKIAIAGLALVPLVISCAATDQPDPSADTAASSAPEETVVVADPVASSPQPAPVAENRLIDLEAGMQYADARARLLQQGWIPAESTDPPASGVEQMAYEAGFTEVAGCAGTGAGQCRFDFSHPDEQQALAVITYGGAQLEVGDWNVQPAAASAAATPDDSSVQNVIPMQFQGLWDSGLEICSSPLSDGRLLIGLDRLDFYESSASVVVVVTRGELEMTVTAEYSGEGSVWTESRNFQLSSDLSTLTNLDNNTVKYRCPN